MYYSMQVMGNESCETFDFVNQLDGYYHFKMFQQVVELQLYIWPYMSFHKG